MTLLLDIGNSFTEAAIWDGVTTLPQTRFPTDTLSTHLPDLLTNTTDIVLSSVVPKADIALHHYLATQAHHTRLHSVSWQNIPILKLNLPHPEQIGADRLVNALGAYATVNSSVLVIDCGTATTCCYVDKNGVYQGGAILPGMRLASQALHDHTAKIPLIFVQKRDELFGKTTEEAVQSGLFHSHIFAINGFITACKATDPEVTVIGTGNGLELLKAYLSLDNFDPQLIFRGLALCAAHQKS